MKLEEKLSVQAERLARSSQLSAHNDKLKQQLRSARTEARDVMMVIRQASTLSIQSPTSKASDALLRESPENSAPRPEAGRDWLDWEGVRDDAAAGRTGRGEHLYQLPSWDVYGRRPAESNPEQYV